MCDIIYNNNCTINYVAAAGPGQLSVYLLFVSGLLVQHQVLIIAGNVAYSEVQLLLHAKLSEHASDPRTDPRSSAGATVNQNLIIVSA